MFFNIYEIIAYMLASLYQQVWASIGIYMDYYTVLMIVRHMFGLS